MILSRNMKKQLTIGCTGSPKLLAPGEPGVSRLDNMPDQVIRFGISDGHEHQAATWKLWTPSNGSDVYLACRKLGGALKASLPNPGLRYVVLTCLETGPCMPFLFPGSSPGQACLVALRSGFLRTVPRGSALAFG
jgi:hypothetical protein